MLLGYKGSKDVCSVCVCGTAKGSKKASARREVPLRTLLRIV
jgi:hypothetical protein